jgi:hypothetical protein
MTKIYNLLYILAIVLVIAVILYVAKQYFVGEGFLDLVSYCRDYPEKDKKTAALCLASTMECGFNKWTSQQPKGGLILNANIPYKTKALIGKDVLGSGDIGLDELTEKVVEACKKKFPDKNDLIKQCSIDNMAGVLSISTTQYARRNDATDYLTEPDCKGYAPKDNKTMGGSSPAPAEGSSSTVSPNSSGGITGSSVSSSSSSSSTNTSTAKIEITMKDVEKLVEKYMNEHETLVH